MWQPEGKGVRRPEGKGGDREQGRSFGDCFGVLGGLVGMGLGIYFQFVFLGVRTVVCANK